VKRSNVLFAAVAWIAVVRAVGLGAEPVVLRDLLGALPKNCQVVCGIPDVRRTVAAVRRWANPIVTEVVPGPILGMFNWGLDLPVKVVTGPAVAAWHEKALLVVAGTGLSQAQVTELLAQHVGGHENQGLIAFGAPNRPYGFCAVRGGRIFGSNRRQALHRFLESPPDANGSILAVPDAAALLNTDEVAESSFFMLKPAGVLGTAPTRKRTRGARYSRAFQRRVLAAVNCLCPVEAPSVACLHLGEHSVVLKAITRMPPLNVGVPAAAGPSLLAGACPILFRGWGTEFASAPDRLAMAMNAFDPDVETEFREEMAELDRDLGYDFQRDLLATLGAEWEFGVILPEDDPQPTGVFTCALRDRDKFIRCAARLAQVSKEPWSEKEVHKGARRFATRAFTVPLEVAVTENRLMVASSAQAVQAALDLARKESPRSGSTTKADASAVTWAVQGRARLAVLAHVLPTDPKAAAFLFALSRSPDTAQVVLELRRPPDTLSLEVRLEGLSPEDLQQWVPALRRSLGERRQAAKRAACMNNISQILSGCHTCQTRKKRFPKRLRDLVPEFLADARVFQCPSAAKRIGPDGKPLPSYRYLGGLDTGQLRGNMVVLYDLKGNHPGGRNVGYSDGHVSWRTEAQFTRELARSLQRVKQAIAKARKAGEKPLVNMQEMEAFYQDRPVAGR